MAPEALGVIVLVAHSIRWSSLCRSFTALGRAHEVCAPQPECSGIVDELSRWTARQRRLAAFAGRSWSAMLWLALLLLEACRVRLHCRVTGKYGSCGVRSPDELILIVSDGTAPQCGESGLGWTTLWHVCIQVLVIVFDSYLFSEYTSAVRATTAAHDSHSGRHWHSC